LIGICPEQKIIPFVSIAWAYGPIASGASFVLTVFMRVLSRIRFAQKKNAGN